MWVSRMTMSVSYSQTVVWLLMMEDCDFQILSFLLHLEISGTFSLRAVGELQDCTAFKSQDTIRFKYNKC